MIALFSAAIFYICAVIIYRLYLHPISSFPGPKLAAVTGLYEFYFNVVKGGTFIWEVKRMHERYGPIVRITPDELHVKDSQFYDEIYAGASRQRDRYLPSTRTLGLPDSSAATVDHDLHRSRRRILTNYFSKQSVRSLEPLIKEKIDKLLGRLEKANKNGTIIRLDSAFSALAGDVTSEYTYGYSHNYLDHETFRNDVREAIINLLGIGHIARFFPFVPTMLQYIPHWIVQRFHSGAAQILEFRKALRKQSAETLRNHVRGPQKGLTIFDAMNDPRLPEKERTINRLENEGFLILGAGTETTAQPLNVILFHLLHNKPLLSKLHYEVKRIMPDPNTPVTWASFESIPFLRAVINEGLRLANGPMSRLPRVAPKEALNYQGWVIPPGTPVSEYGYFVHRDENIFPNPHLFDPERWIKADEVDEHLQNKIVAFLRGSRQCVGQNLAFAIMYLTVANVVRRFDMELYETGLENIEPVRDKVFGLPKNSTDGVRVFVTQAFN